MEGRVKMAEKKKKYCVTIVETLEVAVYVYAESEEQVLRPRNNLNRRKSRNNRIYHLKQRKR